MRRPTITHGKDGFTVWWGREVHLIPWKTAARWASILPWITFALGILLGAAL